VESLEIDGFSYGYHYGRPNGDNYIKKSGDGYGCGLSNCSPSGDGYGDGNGYGDGCGGGAGCGEDLCDNGHGNPSDR